MGDRPDGMYLIFGDAGRQVILPASTVTEHRRETTVRIAIDADEAPAGRSIVPGTHGPLRIVKTWEEEIPMALDATFLGDPHLWGLWLFDVPHADGA